MTHAGYSVTRLPNSAFGLVQQGDAVHGNGLKSTTIHAYLWVYIREKASSNLTGILPHTGRSMVEQVVWHHESHSDSSYETRNDEALFMRSADSDDLFVWVATPSVCGHREYPRRLVPGYEPSSCVVSPKSWEQLTSHPGPHHPVGKPFGLSPNVWLHHHISLHRVRPLGSKVHSLL